MIRLAIQTWKMLADGHCTPDELEEAIRLASQAPERGCPEKMWYFLRWVQAWRRRLVALARRIAQRKERDGWREAPEPVGTAILSTLARMVRSVAGPPGSVGAIVAGLRA